MKLNALDDGAVEYIDAGAMPINILRQYPFCRDRFQNCRERRNIFHLRDWHLSDIVDPTPGFQFLAHDGHQQ